MDETIVNSLVSRIIERQDANGCWQDVSEDDKYHQKYRHYMPKYQSTLWTLILLADMKADPGNDAFVKPLNAVTQQFFNDEVGINTLGKDHFPIPCLNGNMLYILSYFQYQNRTVVDRIVDFFAAYQRFDDGDYKTPTAFPYCSNRSCYGKHTCYWGVVKLLKGLSFIPKNERSQNAQKLISDCIDFVLLHHVCFSSQHPTEFLHTNIKHLTFPNMYQSDFLELLWLLKREHVHSTHMKDALQLLKNKMKPDSTWVLERQMNDLIVPVGRKNQKNAFITSRALEVLAYYDA